MMKTCVNCGDYAMNKRSSYCESCFEEILSVKIREGEKDERDEN